MIQSPLNYTGGKYKLLSQILPLFPNDIDTFIDLFCGGCNVGINVAAKKHVYNDTNKMLQKLYEKFKNNDAKRTLKTIHSIIKKYDLSSVSEYGYSYYNCDSSSGLGKYNKDKFIKLRSDFNTYPKKDYYYYILLYVLIVYSFNNQIRFNGSGDFNLPVGKRDFNKRMESKLVSFIETIKAQDAFFSCTDFRKFNIDNLSPNDFIYLDPPYLITCATYNENDGWNVDSELALLYFMEKLTSKNIKFALSNVLKSKGKENSILINWLKRNEDTMKVHRLQYSYANSNYHTKDRSSSAEEVLITNY